MGFRRPITFGPLEHGAYVGLYWGRYFNKDEPDAFQDRVGDKPSVRKYFS